MKGLLIPIRKGKTWKLIAGFLAVNIIAELAVPAVALALTSGPAQEEFASFEPVSTTDMVDLYSGDFTYNIPLLSVPGPNGGYPINLAYHSGVGMEQEASWVGLGWSLNVGAINRQLRGLPDDFKGDNVKQQMHLKPNRTVGIDIPDFKEDYEYREAFGVPPNDKHEVDPSAVQFQVYYNNYRGIGYRVMYNPQRQNKQSTGYVKVGLSYDSQGGIGIEPSLNLAGKHKDIKASLSLSTTINTREGTQGANFSGQITKSRTPELSPEPGTQKSGLGFGSRSSLTYSFGQSIPSVAIPMKNTTTPVRIKIGKNPTFFGDFRAEFPGIWSGFVVNSIVANGGMANSAGFGYLYTQEASLGDHMLDFNRANIAYSKKIPNLPPSSYTHDLYMHTGQGTGGMFRPYRSSVALLTDKDQHNLSKTQDLGLEYAGFTTPYFHIGIGYTKTSGTLSSGKWASGDETFLSNAGSKEADYEPYYFQEYGEKTTTFINDYYLDAWEGEQALRVKLDKENGWLNRSFVATDKFGHQEFGPEYTLNAQMRHKKTRQTRAKLIQGLTNNDAENYGFTQNKTFRGNEEDHHLSEIVVTQPDGTRYIYGLPAYNEVHIDANFSVDKPNADHNTVRVDVEADDYDETRRAYLSKTTLPPYAHSWLLSAVVSSDYVDLTHDGPTPDDYGYWVKFNYSNALPDFEWRIPYQGNNFQEGNMSDPHDDAAYYSYGQKDVLYLESIETKTHKAKFSTSPRKDGFEAGGEYAKEKDNDQGSRSMHRLDRIDLYTQNDLNQSASPTPIKSVHFKYDYSLCPGVPNNDGTGVDVDGNPPAQSGKPDINAKKGKLTLKKLFFTYQHSNRGALSPYEFGYGDPDYVKDNPPYNPRNMDRWGNYQPNDINYDQGIYPYVNFPYTQQDNRVSDNHPPVAADYEPVAAPWSLKQIELPSGGTLAIEYESDDYAYVEDKKAMRMYDIVGLDDAVNHQGALQVPTADYPFRDKNDVRAKSLKNGTDGKYRVYFELETPLDPSLSQQERSNYLAQYYLEGVDKLWFKSLIDLKNASAFSERDYVRGYADLVSGNKNNPDYFGVVKHPVTNDYSVGYITLEGVPLNQALGAVNVGNPVHPFLKAALQHLKVERSELVYNIEIPDGSAVAQVSNLFGSVFGIMDDLAAAILGFNLWGYTKGYCQKAYLKGNSIIRLNDSDGKKYGGGVRVKSLTLSDNWDDDGDFGADNVPDNIARYGQTYDYTLMEDGRRISSGVAYEPAIGGEESPLRSPITYKESTPLSTTKNLFLEKPILESYYPGARVGYRKVTVESIAPREADLADNNLEDKSVSIENTHAPISIYEFYTPRDFPVLTDQTDMNADPAIIRPLAIPGVYSSFKKRIARSQGYAIVLNDMAGKLKSLEQRTRPGDTRGSNLISKEEYVYHTKGAGELDNKVAVVTADGTYELAIVGESHDIFVDMHENLEKSKSRGLEGNLDLFVPGPTFPAPPFLFFIMPIPYLADNELSLKTTVTTKVVHRSGILKEVVTTTNESVIRTQNLAFDAITGSPILTQVSNEFRDPIYNYSYPAHWYYEGMGAAYRNTGFEVLVTAGSGQFGGGTNQFYYPGASGYFTEGDELWVNNSFRAHVTDISGDDVTVLRSDGSTTGPISRVKIIRSGRKNLLNTQVGTLACKAMNGFHLPPKGSPGTFTPDKILDASAISFSDQWQSICGQCGFDPSLTNDPYITGSKGLWRPERSYAFVTDRVYQNNIREDGIFSGFVPFPWSDPDTKDDRWVTVNMITKYSPHGFELENLDAIGNYAAALYGYGNALATAVAENAQYKEIAFDPVEDYALDACILDDHFSFAGAEGVVITETRAHTGRRSIKVAPGATVSLGRTTIDCDDL